VVVFKAYDTVDIRNQEGATCQQEGAICQSVTSTNATFEED
jgi:hypothetical protein